VQLNVAPNNQAACVIRARGQPYYAAVRCICRATHNRIVDRDRYLSWRCLQIDALDDAVNGVVCTCVCQEDQGACCNACCAAHDVDQALQALPDVTLQC
jgi:transposase